MGWNDHYDTHYYTVDADDFEKLIELCKELMEHVKEELITSKDGMLEYWELK